jgi:N-acetylglutamate synthase
MGLRHVGHGQIEMIEDHVAVALGQYNQYNASRLWWQTESRANLSAALVSDTNMPDFLPMTPDQLPEVIDLWTRTEGVGLNESDSLAALTGFLKRNPGLSRVACQGEIIVAALLCGHDGRRGFLYHLAVRSEYRGGGLGRALVEQCLAALAELGIQKCNGLVYTHNAEAQRFWQRLGFSVREDLGLWQRTIHTLHEPARP